MLIPYPNYAHDAAFWRPHRVQCLFKVHQTSWFGCGTCGSFWDVHGDFLCHLAGISQPYKRIKWQVIFSTSIFVHVCTTQSVMPVVQILIFTWKIISTETHGAFMPALTLTLLHWKKIYTVTHNKCLPRYEQQNLTNKPFQFLSLSYTHPTCPSHISPFNFVAELANDVHSTLNCGAKLRCSSSFGAVNCYIHAENLVEKQWVRERQYKYWLLIEGLFLKHWLTYQKNSHMLRKSRQIWASVNI